MCVYWFLTVLMLLVYFIAFESLHKPHIPLVLRSNHQDYLPNQRFDYSFVSTYTAHHNFVQILQIGNENLYNFTCVVCCHLAQNNQAAQSAFDIKFDIFLARKLMAAY